MNDQVILLALIPFSLLATLVLTRWAGMHKQRDYLFVFSMLAFLIFVGTGVVLLSLSSPPRTVSRITIHVEPTTVTVGENVTVSGILDPKRVGVSVRIRWLRPEVTWGTLATATTDATSRFSFVWTPEVAGTYKLHTEWLGDQTSSYTMSHKVVVTVVGGETK